MGCSCSTPKAFKVEIDGKETILYGLDQVVFTTILSFPETDEQAAEELWQGLLLFNDKVNPEEEKPIKKALIEIYTATKKEYGYPDKVQESKA
ncbi:MAG TPA: hypothetical protein PL001_07455 [Candidatus Kryptobacter bacterium]|nr:hypothetical protein [Candidatus Kryptobacter bacterium]